MRFQITTHLSLYNALVQASPGDTIVCPNESMRALGERGAKRYSGNELIWEVAVEDPTGRNFHSLHQLMGNFPMPSRRRWLRTRRWPNRWRTFSGMPGKH